MSLLRFAVLGLRLNPRAPWPSEVVRRRRYRMRALMVVSPMYRYGKR